MFVEIYDWLISNLLFFWLVVAVFFLLLEMGSPGLFFFLSFFFGSLVTAAITFFTRSIILQSVVFLFASVLSFVILHVWVKKKERKSKPHERTNIYALIGKRAKVLTPILPPESGKVKVNGEIWSARSYDQCDIIDEEYVEIINIIGSHLIVKAMDIKKKPGSCE